MGTQPAKLEVLAAQLQTLPIFRNLDPPRVAQLARSAVRRTYPAGGVIFLEGESAPAFCYVATGWVKIVKMSPAGREQILYLWGPGELFGGVGAFVERPAPATAIVLEAAELWILRRTAVRQVFAADPALALGVIEFMAGRIDELVQLVADLSLHSVTERLARMLLEQAEDDVVQRRLWATQSEMAARLGTVPDVLNRALRGLVEEELIEFSRQQIRILDRQGLAAKAIPAR